jgi:hypothetical protein
MNANESREIMGLLQIDPIPFMIIRKWVTDKPQDLKKKSIPEKMKKKNSKLNNQAKSNKVIPRNNKTLVYLIFHPK